MSFIYIWSLYSKWPILNAIIYDDIAQPATLIVLATNGPTAAAAAVYYTNGTFYKYLAGFSSISYIGLSQGATIDANGYIFLTDTADKNVFVFSPYPDYTFITAITDLMGSINIANGILGTGSQYLAVIATLVGQN